MSTHFPLITLTNKNIQEPRFSRPWRWEEGRPVPCVPQRPREPPEAPATPGAETVPGGIIPDLGSWLLVKNTRIPTQ